jgi:hypothetical protein
VHAIGFDQSIQSEGSSSFSLAPPAMAAMDEEGIHCHPVAHEAARATAVV